MFSLKKNHLPLTIIILSVFGLGFPFYSFGVVELDFEFGYSKQVYGVEKENSKVSRTYSGSITKYFLTYTGFELNYSNDEVITTEETDMAVTGTTVSIDSLQNKVRTTVYGIGLRQALAGKKAFIRPTLSFGYAKQFVRDRTEYTFRNDITGEKVVVKGTLTKQRVESVFASFALNLRLSELMSIKGTVRSVFPAFETNLAKDNLKYTLGLTWYF